MTVTSMVLKIDSPPTLTLCRRVMSASWPRVVSDVGVPDIIPVAALILSPCGRVPSTMAQEDRLPSDSATRLLYC